MAKRTKSSPGNRQMLCHLGFVRQAGPPCGIYGKDHTFYDGGELLRNSTGGCCLLVRCGPEVSGEPQDQRLGRKAGRARTPWNPKDKLDPSRLATSNNTGGLQRELALFTTEPHTHLAQASGKLEEVIEQELKELRACGLCSNKMCQQIGDNVPELQG